jgi:hypothetical protein
LRRFGDGIAVAARFFHNDREHPQVLVWGLKDQDAKILLDVFPGSRRISGLDEVHQPEWDLLIVCGQNLEDVEPGLFVIAFGGRIIGRAEAHEPAPVPIVLCREVYHQNPNGEWLTRSVSTVFTSPESTPFPLVELVADDLVPLLTKEGAHSCLLACPIEEDGPGELTLKVPNETGAILLGSDAAVYAAHFRRHGGKSWCLSLPIDAALFWVIAAVNHWHTLDRRRFPTALDWTTSLSERWSMPDESAAAATLASAVQAREQAEVAEREAKTRLEETRAVARAGAFRLLNSGDDSLEAVVRDALVDLGFNVREMDREQPPNDRVEDLRVSLPDRPGWIALVEIKGYSRSRGKAEDLLSLSGRFAKRFRTEEKRDPDALWYVLNHDMGTDPDARKAVFEGSERELAAFADGGGLAIDTRDLYRLWRMVQVAELSAKDARATLVGATGRYKLESTSTSPAD